MALNITHCNNFQVLVGNGDHMQCNSYSSNVPICLGTTKFLIDLYILPINLVDVILDIQWLKTLGPIITNYDILTMQFNYLGKTIHLQGLRDDDIKEISSSQLKRLHDAKSISAFCPLELSSFAQQMYLILPHFRVFSPL